MTEGSVGGGWGGVAGRGMADGGSGGCQCDQCAMWTRVDADAAAERGACDATASCDGMPVQSVESKAWHVHVQNVKRVKNRRTGPLVEREPPARRPPRFSAVTPMPAPFRPTRSRTTDPPLLPSVAPPANVEMQRKTRC